MSKKKKDWKTEKERLLRMDRDERRKEGYRRQDYISLDKIPTWREDNYSDGREDGNVLTGTGGLSEKVSLYKGDITVLELDAIVNAANSSLLGGGGVDGCIHKAAGSCLYDECQTLNGCETGKAKITCGYDLPARFVIHTVGPVARGHVGPTETNDLTSCYQNSLRLVKEYGLSTVAFPCISTGIYGFPNEPAGDIALNTVKSWIEENPNTITRVIFCVFLETDFNIYKKKMSIIFEGKEEAGDENKADSDAEGIEDVVMESQNPDDDVALEELNQEEDENNSQGKCDDIGTEQNKHEDTVSEKKDKEDDKEDELSAAKTEEKETSKSTVEMEVVSETAAPGTSTGEGIKDHADSSGQHESILTDSMKSKDAAEKKE
uniref:Mono-ADP ribosylhydrolase 2 n=1 Tax=Hippocampus comes TaxID=109280 RepID=A0A3Q2ZAH4_HIPCM